MITRYHGIDPSRGSRLLCLSWGCPSRRHFIEGVYLPFNPRHWWWWWYLLLLVRLATLLVWRLLALLLLRVTRRVLLLLLSPLLLLLALILATALASPLRLSLRWTLAFIPPMAPPATVVTLSRKLLFCGWSWELRSLLRMVILASLSALLWLSLAHSSKGSLTLAFLRTLACGFVRGLLISHE